VAPWSKIRTKRDAYIYLIDEKDAAQYNGNRKYQIGFQGSSFGGRRMDEAVKLRIVKEAAALFNAKGYRTVTLSELAARLGMSKKTLYQYFSGKEEIAAAVLEGAMTAIAGAIAGQMKRDGDPLRLLQEAFAGIKRELTKLHPLFLEQIQIHAPALWERLESFRSRQLAFIEELLTRAQAAGLIRDVNPRLAAAVMLESIQRMVRPDFAARHGVTPLEVADTLFTLFLEGLRVKSSEQRSE
jgi:AcrR family transcriptional regulator